MLHWAGTTATATKHQKLAGLFAPDVLNVQLGRWCWLSNGMIND
jgi:hypothetical protein